MVYGLGTSVTARLAQIPLGRSGRCCLRMVGWRSLAQIYGKWA